jgi:hypothetical protein
LDRARWRIGCAGWGKMISGFGEDRVKAYLQEDIKSSLAELKSARMWGERSGKVDRGHRAGDFSHTLVFSLKLQMQVVSRNLHSVKTAGWDAAQPWAPSPASRNRTADTRCPFHLSPMCHCQRALNLPSVSTCIPSPNLEPLKRLSQKVCAGLSCHTVASSR